MQHSIHPIAGVRLPQPSSLLTTGAGALLATAALLGCLAIISACRQPDRKLAQGPADASSTQPADPGSRVTRGTLTASDGVEISFTEQGSGSPTLMFVHCWCCNQSFWDPQIAAFAGSSRVVTLDLAGHGASTGTRPGWPLESLAGDVRTVAEALDLDHIILIGHSMGGPVAVEAALLLGDRVIGVIGVDTLQDVEREMDPAQIERLVGNLAADFPTRCDAFVRTMFPDGADEALENRVTGDMCDADPEMALSLLSQLLKLDLAAALDRLHVPVRCINATRVPTNVEGNRRHADFDVRLMDGVGHFLYLERPDEFNSLLAETIAEISSASQHDPAGASTASAAAESS